MCKRGTTATLIILQRCMFSMNTKFRSINATSIIMWNVFFQLQRMSTWDNNNRRSVTAHLSNVCKLCQCLLELLFGLLVLILSSFQIT